MRRIVTGHDDQGRSIVARDEEVAVQTVPGMDSVGLATVWGADEPMAYPDGGDKPAFSTFFPPRSGFRFIEFTLLPGETAAVSDSAAQDDTAARTEALFPGLLATMDPQAPGMHRSETVDLLYVASGKILLELDDGSQTELSAGDCVVQSATMHAWRNPYEETSRIIGVLLGAQWKPA